MLAQAVGVDRAGHPAAGGVADIRYVPQVTNRVVRTGDGDVPYLSTVGDEGRVLDMHTGTALEWRPGPDWGRPDSMPE
ncbi:hypothetical protein ACWEPH_27415 [Nocardia beijingensis]|uniref:hypothetical protein n=1 Tax=Nocardia beijingensis TaxID=95162 RepID=UPI0033BB2CC2